MPDDTPAPPLSDELRALDPDAAPPPADDNASPGDAGLQPPAAALSLEDAAQLARVGVDWVLDAAVAQYPVLVYPEATRDRAAQLAGAVLAKYDVLKWAGRWREEFALGLFVAGLAWESYQRVQAAKPAPPVTDQAPPAPAQSPVAGS